MKGVDGREASDAFARVLVEGGLRVVLRADLAAADAERWVVTPPKLTEKDPHFVVSRGAKPSALPTALARWAGRRVRLMKGTSPVCEATLTGFDVVAGVHAGYEEQDRWNGSAETKTAPAPSDQIAREVWEATAEHGRALTIDVHPLSGRCDGATWARAVDLSVPVMSAVAQAEPALSARALQQLRGMTGYAEGQRNYEQMVLPADSQDRGSNPPPTWERWYGSALAVSTARLPDGTATLVWAALATTNKGCGGFIADVEATYQITGPDSSGPLQLVSEGNPNTAGEPPELGAVLDGDGKVEWIPRYKGPWRPMIGCEC